MRSHVNTAQWDAETRKEHTVAPSLFDSIAAWFFKKTPQLRPVSVWFLGVGSSTSHLFKKADAMTSYCIGFGNEGKEAAGICYKPST